MSLIDVHGGGESGEIQQLGNPVSSKVSKAIQKLDVKIHE